MSGGGGGTTTQTVNNAPPPEFMAAYRDIVARAQGVAGTPYQQYPGPTVADLSPDQYAGIQAIENAQGISIPYINSSADYISSSLGGLPQATAEGVGGIRAAGNTFTPDSIQQFVNPWTDQVVNATQAQFNNQNQQQANNLRGNAISSGAFGGDREAVAQGVLAGQQQLAQAPVIAGLQSQGYQAGIQAAEAQAAQRLQAAQAAGGLGLQGAQAYTAAQLQAAQQMAALGGQAQNQAISGAGALLGVGGLEQQQAQALMNVPYQQWQAELAYPFQTTSWLSGLTTGLGGASGGTSTSSSTQPGASTGSQVLGAGLAGLGALGQSGAFGNNGWLTGSNGLFGSGSNVVSPSTVDYNAAYQAGAFANQPAGTYGPFQANGGAIQERAFGGMISDDAPGMTPVKPSGLDVPDLSVSVIPSVAPGGKPLILQNFGQTSSGSGGGPSGGQQAQSAISTIGTIASIAAMVFSDRRLKEDISRVGKLKDGTPLYRFRYKGDPQWHVGFIADNLEKHHPEAVHDVNGYGAVDVKAATDKSAGMRPVNDNWDGGWHEPRRAVGGPVPQLTGNNSVVMVPGGYPGAAMVPHLVAAPLGMTAPTGGPGGGGGLAAYLSAAKGIMPVRPQTWSPAMLPAPPSPSSAAALANLAQEFWGSREGGGGGAAGESGTSGGQGVDASHGSGTSSMDAELAGGAAGADASGSGGMGAGDVNGGMGGMYQRGGMVRLADGGEPILSGNVPDLSWFDGADARGLSAAPAVAPSMGSPSGSLPFSANNPLNIRFVGQPGAVNTRGFAAWPTPEAGMQATNQQFKLYADRGINTLRGLISRWAPPSENDTDAYIARVAKETNIDPDAPLDLTNPATALVVQHAMAGVEGNRNATMPTGGVQYAKADNGVATDATPAPVESAAPAGIAPAPAPEPAKGSADPWSALTYAGLGIMGGNSPNAGVNIGRGALAGLQAYNQQKLHQQQVDALAAYRQQQGASEAARIAEQARHNKETEATTARRLADAIDLQRSKLNLETANADEAKRHNQALEDRGSYTWTAGTGPDAEDPSKQVAGSWRYATKGDETPKFFPGVVQTQKGGDTGKLSDETTTMIAQRLIAGDQGAMSGLGYGNTGAANRAAVQEKVTQLMAKTGLTGADLAAKTAEYMGERAGARTAGTREANISMAINEAQQFAPLAVAASDKVQRTNFPTLNSLEQAVAKGTGDENVVRLQVATNSLINAYARAVTPSGIPTEGNQTRARELLDRAWSQGQYKAAVDQLMIEMKAAQKSPLQTREEQRSRISGRSQSDEHAPAPIQAIPPEAAAKLQEGHITTFGNGQRWTLKNGVPQQVQ